jgi:hypothetical protein
VTPTYGDVLPSLGDFGAGSGSESESGFLRDVREQGTPKHIVIAQSQHVAIGSAVRDPSSPEVH